MLKCHRISLIFVLVLFVEYALCELFLSLDFFKATREREREIDRDRDRDRVATHVIK